MAGMSLFKLTAILVLFMLVAFFLTAAVLSEVKV